MGNFIKGEFIKLVLWLNSVSIPIHFLTCCRSAMPAIPSEWIASARLELGGGKHGIIFGQ